MTASALRHVVLDSEAVSALLTTRRSPRRTTVVEAIAAATGRVVVPVSVRVEAGWDRTSSRAADANRIVPADADLALDAAGANRASQRRELVPRASVVDATVAVAAEIVGARGGVVEVLTSDQRDIVALGMHLRATLDVIRL